MRTTAVSFVGPVFCPCVLMRSDRALRCMRATLTKTDQHKNTIIMFTTDESNSIETFEQAILWRSARVSVEDFERMLDDLPPVDDTWRERYQYVARYALSRAVYSPNALLKFKLLLFHDHKCGKVKDDSRGTLLLHEACRMRDCPIEIIQLLIDMWPNAVFEEDSFGWLPFHCACIQWNLKLVKLPTPLQSSGYSSQGYKRTTTASFSVSSSTRVSPL